MGAGTEGWGVVSLEQGRGLGLGVGAGAETACWG